MTDYNPLHFSCPICYADIDTEFGFTLIKEHVIKHTDDEILKWMINCERDNLIYERSHKASKIRWGK